MILTPPERIKEMKCRDLVDLKCDFCAKDFKRRLNLCSCYLGIKVKDYCSRACQGISSRDEKTKLYNCGTCGKEIFKKKNGIRKNKGGQVFCSHSCSATYQNTHKTKGTRVSKLERYIAELLETDFPDVEFHFNRKDAIESELDIYIPSLKLAFELNGIFHYEPIFGAEQLTKIQNNDGRKYQACIDRGIELCIIDSSKLKYHKESNARPYYEIVRKIITDKMARTP